MRFWEVWLVWFVDSFPTDVLFGRREPPSVSLLLVQPWVRFMVCQFGGISTRGCTLIGGTLQQNSSYMVENLIFLHFVRLEESRLHVQDIGPSVLDGFISVPIWVFWQY